MHSIIFHLFPPQKFDRVVGGEPTEKLNEQWKVKKW